MAKIHYDSSGRLTALWDGDNDPSGGTVPPGSTAGTLEIDSETNAAVVSDVLLHWNRHTVSGGKLRKDGSIVAIAPDSPKTDNKKFVKNQLAAIRDALKNGTATNTQIQRALLFVINEIAR